MFNKLKRLYYLTLIRLRVHFVPVGFEVVRVVEPLRALRPDAVFLVTSGERDKATDYLSKIQELLTKQRIRHSLLLCDVWDATKVADMIGATIRSAPEHDYFFNVGTGTKPCTIAGVLASLIYGITPYYVQVDYEAKPQYLPLDFPTKGPLQILPSFRVPPLDGAAIEALSFLALQEKGIPKRTLLAHMKEKGFVKARSGGMVSPQALQAQVNAILTRLHAWNFVRIDGRGSRLSIQLTAQGQGGARMFRHMRGPPGQPPKLFAPNQ